MFPSDQRGQFSKFKPLLNPVLQNPKLPDQGIFTRPESLRGQTGKLRSELNFGQNMKVLGFPEIYNFHERKFFRIWIERKIGLFSQNCAVFMESKIFILN